MQIQNIPEYELIQQETIEDIHSEGYFLKHKKSGARVLILENDDENKVFHIAFRTPPADSTGVAHILEHSVLCGSKQFPSKDPFVELVKGSLNTFLNAMTYPDKTMYPVASCNEKDFCNLMHVYMDAVFETNIYRKEEIFRQEGWSYQLEDAKDELTYNGVVYNEMKGAFSSPEDVIEREIMTSLFPDTTYGCESGGDPSCIPDLTYEQFLAFHKKYYHPSNSYIYLYGNADMEERLRWLDRTYLSKYEKEETNSSVSLQQPFSKISEVYKKYSISNNDSEKDNTYLAYNAVIGTSLDVELANAFAVLEYALLSAPGAPLKQALLDAGIGKDIMGSYDSGVYQPVFSVMAKYANASDKEAFLQTIQQELRRQVEEGIDKKALLAGINNMEFKFREADYGSFPKGLIYGIDCMDSWLYDENQPFAYLKQLGVFRKLREKVNTSYFEELIQKWILDNPHASLLVAEPEKGLTAKIDEELREKLAAYKASLSDKEIEELVENTKKLRVFQETPSTKEELEAIPVLKREDIKKEAAPLYNEEHWMGDTLILHHKMYTNGIGYLKLLFDTRGVKSEDLPYLSLLKSVLGLVDTEHYTYGELSNEINIYSGGISAGLSLYSDLKKENKYRAMLEWRGKALYSQLKFVFDMIEEMMFTSKLSDEKRLYEILSEQKSQLQMRLNGAGHTAAATRAMSYYSTVALFNDKTGGIDYYHVIADLEANFEERKAALIEKLQSLAKMVFTRERLMVSYTADEEGFAPLKELVSELKEKLPGMETVQETDYPVAVKRNEAFGTSSKVQYVARAGSYAKAGYTYTGALRILKVIMSYEYLWVNIRVKGGAYGCMSGFGRMGSSYFVSYRDPNLKKTNETYEGIPEFVKTFTVDDRDMLKYIIGTISELDIPMNPSAKGGRSLNAYLGNLSYEDLQKERDEILNADQEAIRALAPLMEAILKEEAICVIGNEEKIKQDQDLFMEIKPLIGV